MAGEPKTKPKKKARPKGKPASKAKKPQPESLKRRSGGAAAGVFVGLLVVGAVSWFVFGDARVVPEKPLPKVDISKAMKTGKPDPARLTVLRAITAIKPLIDDCYQYSLSKAPGLEGTVVVEFMAEWENKEGFVFDAHLMEPKGVGQGLEKCLRDTIIEVKFKAPSGVAGQQRVVFPFAFERKGSSSSTKSKGKAKSRKGRKK